MLKKVHIQTHAINNRIEERSSSEKRNELAGNSKSSNLLIVHLSNLINFVLNRSFESVTFVIKFE